MPEKELFIKIHCEKYTKEELADILFDVVEQNKQLFQSEERSIGQICLKDREIDLLREIINDLRILIRG